MEKELRVEIELAIEVACEDLAVRLVDEIENCNPMQLLDMAAKHYGWLDKDVLALQALLKKE